jgi:hypothetical protein
MALNHHIIVSAENSAYMAWQCQLFHYSCLTRLNRVPTIFVHAAGRIWHPGFLEIIKAGGIVRPARNYAFTRGGDKYVLRNAPGTLLHAAGLFAHDDRFLVLCDPDMIFLREPEFPAALSFDAVDYLSYDRDDVRAVARRLGVALNTSDERQRKLCGGVPHVIPTADARRLAELWLESIDAFPAKYWVAVMYALGLAVMKLGRDVTLTRHAILNYSSYAPADADMIHYCQGDEIWNKRRYRKEDAARVWGPTVAAPRGTVLGEILAQLVEAREFYRRPSYW